MTFVSLLPLGRAARSAVAVLAVTTLSGLYPAFAQQEPTPSEAPASPEAPAAGPADAAVADPAAAQAEAPVDTVPVDRAEPALPADPQLAYTFAATRFRHTEFDDSADDGFGIEGSYLLGPNVYAVGAVFAAESDDARGTESTQFELGGGYRAPLNATMDLNAAIRLTQRDIDSEPQSQVKMGFQVDAGVRASLSPRMEGTLGARYAETSRNARAFLTGATLFELSRNFSLGAEAVVGSNSTSYGLLGRWAF